MKKAMFAGLQSVVHFCSASALLLFSGCDKRVRDQKIVLPEAPLLVDVPNSFATDKSSYLDGYHLGWTQFQARWRIVVHADGSYRVEGNWVECAKGAGAFDQGLEDGQLAAHALAEQIEMKVLSNE